MEKEDDSSLTETERLTRKMKILGPDGSEFRIALPSVPDTEALLRAFKRAGLDDLAQGGTYTPNLRGKALDAMYGLWEALGARVEPLKPPIVSPKWESRPQVDTKDTAK